MNENHLNKEIVFNLVLLAFSLIFSKFAYIMDDKQNITVTLTTCAAIKTRNNGR